MDVLAGRGAVFELKAVEALTDRHRSQLLNYLLLADLAHGKLANLRPHRVEHEFVNTTLKRADRTTFDVCDGEWHEAGNSIRELAVAMLRDWGTSLDLAVYEEGLIHFLGGPGAVVQDVEIVSHRRPVGIQKMTIASPGVALRITAIDRRGYASYEEHLQRLLEHFTLEAVQWINITRRTVTFKTLC